MLSKVEIERRKRLKKELEICQKSNYLINFGITVRLIDNSNLNEWRCSLVGGRDTPYEGGIFYLRIKFPDWYPMYGPSIYFITPIYHMNVSSTNGCVTNLTLFNWNSNTSMEEVLAQLFLLFYKPNPNGVWNIYMLEEYKKNRELYDNKIKYFTKKYASDTLENRNNDIWDFSYNK